MPVETPRELPFAVDTWTPASALKRHRFLTHAHRDHLAGIATAVAPIYASRLTVLLALRFFPQLDRAAFVEIEAGAPPVRVADPDGDFTVTAFDANHCPGAVMFLFEGAFGTVLHTGDCRLTPDCLHAVLAHPPRRVLDLLFLDCTFARCPLRLPAKDDSIRQVINCIWKHPDAPVVYLVCDMLGQEDVLIEVSKAFGAKIHVDGDKSPDCRHTLSHVAPEILTDDPAASRFHVMPSFPRLCDRAAETLALARAKQQPEPLIIRPSSQWYAHYDASTDASPAQRSRPVLTEPMRDEFGVWHVCLSMHSSRDELEHALRILRPRWVVSTTPPCMAVDLTYVRKHCSLSRLATDDPLWKLLGIPDGMPTTVEDGAGIGDQTSLTAEVTSTDKSQVQEFFCSDGSSQQVEIAEPILQDFAVIVEPEPPVTLFGRARFGLLQDESQLWKDEYYQSVEVISDVETEAMDSATTRGLWQDGMLDESVKEVIDMTEIAVANEQSSATGAELQNHGKSNGEVEAIDLTKDGTMLLSSSTGSELCKDDKCVEVVKGNGEAQEQDLSVRSDLRRIFRSRVTEPGKNRTEAIEEISAVHVSVSAQSNKEAAEDGTSPSEEVGKTNSDNSSKRGADSSTVVGSSKCLNANLRRLYRSMNVSVPRPLPSLVELMGAAKRPRV